jgi:hypothetical protein
VVTRATPLPRNAMGKLDKLQLQADLDAGVTPSG